jgi:AcrR family transcriptional regulator
MPRKIPDLESKILEAARQLFLKNGYLEVSMKQVACEAGTSVGNLYNYFSTKKDLFLAGRRQGLEDFHEHFSQVTDETDPLTTVREMLFLLMETMEKWSGLWEDFMQEVSVNLPRHEAVALHQALKEETHRLIIPKIEAVLFKLVANDSELRFLLELPDSRFAVSLVSLVKFLVKTFPDSRQANRSFLQATLERLLRPGSASFSSQISVDTTQ